MLSEELNINITPFNFVDKESNLDIITRYDLAMLQKMFKYDGLPETIPQRMLEMFLQTNGNVFITDKYDGKLYAYTGGLGGVRDEYYRPTQYTIANPYQEFSEVLTVDTDGILIRNDSMGASILPLLGKWNTLLLETELTMYIADINLRMSQLLSSTDESTKKAADKYIKDITAGKLGVILDESLVNSLTKHSDSANTRYLTELKELYQFIKGTKYSLLGLSSTLNMKRERLNTAEVELDVDTLLPYVDDMLESRRDGIQKVNEMFGTNITVELSSAWGVRHSVNLHLDESEDILVDPDNPDIQDDNPDTPDDNPDTPEDNPDTQDDNQDTQEDNPESEDEDERDENT